MLDLLLLILKWTLAVIVFGATLIGLVGAIWINLFNHSGVKVRSAEWLDYEDAKAQMQARDYASTEEHTLN